MIISPPLGSHHFSVSAELDPHADRWTYNEPSRLTSAIQCAAASTSHARQDLTADPTNSILAGRLADCETDLRGLLRLQMVPADEWEVPL